MSEKSYSNLGSTGASPRGQKYNRRFSEAFKKAKVEEILSNRIGVTEFSKLYQISRSSVYNWIYQYSSLEKGTRQVIEMESEAKKTQRLQAELAELERQLGRKQLSLDYLERLIEIASEELGIDLKKKYEHKF